MEEFELREIISAEFCKALGGNQYARWARIPFVNKTARELAKRFDVMGWPEHDEITRQARAAVQEYA